MLVSGALIGLIAGLAFRRDWRPLSELEIRGVPVLLGALAARLIAPAVPSFGLVLEIVGIAGIGIVALLNGRIVGMPLIAIGSVLNLVVVVANQGMPVAADALLSAGAGMPHDPLHIALGETTKLPMLGDIIPLALFRGVYSIGDFAIAIGGFVVPFRALVKS
jgi:uncharacterized protein DUF5317